MSFAVTFYSDDTARFRIPIKPYPAIGDLDAIYEAYNEFEEDTNAAAGGNTLDFTAVPSGEIWVVTHFSMSDKTTACTRYEYRFIDAAANTSRLKVIQPTFARETLEWNGHIYIPESAYIQALFVGCNAGDTIEAVAIGYKISLY